LKLPESLLLAINLHVEHSGHNVEITGSGPDYDVRFPSLSSVLHFGIALWPMRKWVPEGFVIHLKYRSFSYRYRG
jgi:hypothetical protein